MPTPGALYAFGIEELIDLQRRALSGDGDAAYAISQYYSLRKQWTESDLWAQIGAENGNAIAAEMLARDLYRLGGFHNCLRAVFWLRRSQAAFEAMNAKSQVIDLGDLVAEIEQDDDRCMWRELEQDRSVSPPGN